MKLNRKFFNRNTVVVAQELLGKYLVRKINGKIVKAMITETEAYCGPDDLACHASKGMTPRTKIMFGPPGHAYIYLIYGMYHCFNVVTKKVGCPEAVLVRSVEVVENQSAKIKMQNDNSKFKINGPGRVCKNLEIDKSLNGVDICCSKELWVEDGERVSKNKIRKSKRIGVDYAGKWKDKLWRFHI